MLAVGMLSPKEIAREAGVSKNIVTAVAGGKRMAITAGAPALDVDQRFLPEPIRCSVCHALVSIVPYFDCSCYFR
jgi:hypothetical protein